MCQIGDAMMDVPDLNKPYLSLNQSSTAWVIISTGCFGFKYGPYTPTEAGAIMTEAVERGLGVIVSMECGSTFDWELAEDCCPRLVLDEDEPAPTIDATAPPGAP
jgi:hypothetical protein